MRKTFSDSGLFLLRLASCLAILSHGVPKLIRLEELRRDFPDPLGLGPEMSAMLIVIAEVGCAGLLLAGLLSRLSALILAVTMLGIAMVHHHPDPWSAKELPLLYAAIFASLALTGPGSVSVDRWLGSALFGRSSNEAKSRA